MSSTNPPTPTPIVLAAFPDKEERAFLCDLLPDLGYWHVHRAEAIRDACDILRTEPVSIVLTHHLDGEWVRILEAAQRLHPAPKLITCFSFSQLGASEGDRAIEIGASDVLGMPFRVEELRQALGFARQSLAQRAPLLKVPSSRLVRLERRPRLAVGNREQGRGALTAETASLIRARAAGRAG